MSDIDDDKKINLGDGLHAEFDGDRFKLYTERYNETGHKFRQEVYLDRETLAKFLDFAMGMS